MSKKLISLVLVLALAGIASAAAQWTGPSFTSAAGAWETTSNWDVARLPALTDTSVRWDALSGAGSNITVSTTQTMGQKGQSKFGSTNLTLLTGSVMNCEGSIEQGKGTYSLVTINAGATFNAAQKLTQTNGTYKLSSAAASTDIVDIYGALKVKGSLATSDLSVAPGSGAGIGRVNVKADGLLDVDAYVINGALTTSGLAKRGMIKIERDGLMRIKGDKTVQVTADITAGNIVGEFDNGVNLRIWTKMEGGQTYTYVPEPATIALLGLGSLALLRRKR